MTLDSETKAALRERLQFYRELGVGPLYRREVRGDGPQGFGSGVIDDSAGVADRPDADAGRVAQEAYLPPAKGAESTAQTTDRAALLQSSLTTSVLTASAASWENRAASRLFSAPATRMPN